jgi:AraC-like DNA-binding protein
MRHADTADTNARASVRSLDEFAHLRNGHLDSSLRWWPEIGPVGDTCSFSFTHRTGRVGPITVLDADFHEEVWVNGGEFRPHYHVTLPVATPVAAAVGNLYVATASASVGVHRPEGKAVMSGYAGRLLAVMIDRHAVEDALSDALGRSVTSQIDFQPTMPTATHVVRSWIALITLFTEQMFRPGSLLHQPLIGMPFAESVVRGLLLAADHPYRAILQGEADAPAPRVIRAAIEVIEAEADQPLTVSMLAQRCHVSVRSLQYGFRRHLGTSPMAYLREARLRRAHQTLLESDPSATTVAAVAHRWGFAHPGRFATAHAARYHELPVQTLRRSSKTGMTRPVRAS